MGAVALTGWLRLDPIIALIVAANILRTGWQLLSRSIRGLLDAALPAAEQDAINQVLKHYESKGIQFHALRTRQAGTRAFISLHVLVPADWTVQRGHDLLEHLVRFQARSSLLTWNPRAIPPHGKISHWIARIARREAQINEYPVAS